jgi:hypothetical protein
MSSRFAIVMLAIIVCLLLPMAVNRCQLCQEKGGYYCKVGPRRGLPPNIKLPQLFRDAPLVSNALIIPMNFIKKLMRPQ